MLTLGGGGTTTDQPLLQQLREADDSFNNTPTRRLNTEHIPENKAQIDVTIVHLTSKWNVSSATLSRLRG